MDNSENTVPYDLRQIYAVNIVGEHLQDVARARKVDNFPAYLRSLKDLWITTQHKIKEKDKNAPNDWDDLLKKTHETIRKYPQAFSNKNSNAEARAKVEYNLNKIEMFLFDKIQLAGLFGNKWDDEGL